MKRSNFAENETAMMKPIIKMKSPVKKWEAITIISIMAIVIVDAIVFPILTRNVITLLGRANWLEIIFRIIIDLSFMVCLFFHKKPVAQQLLVFLVIPNISTLMPVLFRYNSFIQWLSPICALFVLFKHYDKAVAWITLLTGIACFFAPLLQWVDGFMV